MIRIYQIPILYFHNIFFSLPTPLDYLVRALHQRNKKILASRRDELYDVDISFLQLC